MSIFKKLFKKLFKKKPNVIDQAPEKKQACWYNNAHENGEAVRGSAPLEGTGSSNAFECHVTQSNAMH